MPRQMPYRTEGNDCVVLTAFEPDFNFLRNILRFARFRVHRAETLEELDFLLIATGATVLLSDTLMPTCTWRCAASLIGDRHPHVAMLVMAHNVDAPYLQDAFFRGLCGIIWKPIEFDVATDLLQTAHQASCDRLLLRQESKLRADLALK